MKLIMKEKPAMKKCKGFTLVELLVSMAIGLFLVTGVISVMLDSKENHLLEQELAYIQENARFAMDEISYDLRMAGYTGCSQDGELTNTVNSVNWNFSSDGVMGYEQMDAPDEFVADVKAGTDVIVVNRGEPNETITVTAHSLFGKSLTLSGVSSFSQGEILVVASNNCSHMTIFQNTGTAPNMVRYTTGSGTPGNCYAALTNDSASGYAGYDCSAPATSGSGMTFPSGSTIMRYSSNAYYVTTSPGTGLPSLFKQTLTANAGVASSVAREVISGVEDLEILYGVDTTNYAAVPVVVNYQYYDADDVPDWDNVVSARITMILRSMREVFPDATAVDLGDGDTFNDRFMRQKVSSTVRIRNRVEGV